MISDARFHYISKLERKIYLYTFINLVKIFIKPLLALLLGIVGSCVLVDWSPHRSVLTRYIHVFVRN